MVQGLIEDRVGVLGSRTKWTTVVDKLNGAAEQNGTPELNGTPRGAPKNCLVTNPVTNEPFSVSDVSRNGGRN